jgi:MFS family permease
MTAMPTIAAPFANTEFRAIWLTRGLSLLGDQLARVALAVLVFERTGSAALTGAAYAATFLPYLVGPVLAGTADRRPRKGILVLLDVARAGTVAAMALPGMPLLWMCVLLALVTAASPLYDAARSAMLPEVLTDGLYPTGLAICSITTETAQVLGFAFGGVLVAALGARMTLAVDAGTFALSAVILARWVRVRPPARTSESGRSRQLRATTRLVLRGPRQRRLVALAWMNAFWIVPEGLAAPYAHHLGGGPVAVGLLLSALPLGCAVGAIVLTSVATHEQRVRLMTPMAAFAGLPLLGCLAQPGLTWSLVLWALCGVGSAYNVAANAAFVQEVPNACRSQAIAIVTTGMVAGQGLAVLLGGLAASLMPPWAVVGLAGGLAVLAAGTLSAIRPVRSRLIDLTGPAVAVAVDR